MKNEEKKKGKKIRDFGFNFLLRNKGKERKRESEGGRGSNGARTGWFLMFLLNIVVFVCVVVRCSLSISSKDVAKVSQKQQVFSQYLRSNRGSN